MKQLFYLILTVILLFQSAVNSFAAVSATVEATSSQPLFLELWNNAAFYDTNLEKKKYASVLARFEGKAGLNVFRYPLQVYGVYYGAASQSNDYWDNYFYSGGGVRLIPFRDFYGKDWRTEWLSGLKIYYEDLSASYFKNAASAEALAKKDTRYGVEIWHEWNQDNPDYRLPWAELWFNYSHRETNFGWEEFKTDVMNVQPKLGIYLSDVIKAYLRGDLVASYKEGPSYTFLNVADYGLGVRFEPWRGTQTRDDLLKKFKMFLEVLGVSYLKGYEPTDPGKRVSSDVRFGIEFSYGR
ncbi:MAG: hypothetical protein PHH60_05395 [Candidatus Margulisbacteria bacterium]|nr:hypothetical protein [Candidatus Margulisiibacteriota bacterium]